MRISSILSFVLIIHCFLLLFPISGFAGDTDDLLNHMKNMMNTAPITQVIAPDSVAAILCDFRRLFYGELGNVIPAVAIFIVGILVLNQKMRPLYAIMIIGLTIIFTHPEIIARAFITSMLFGNQIPDIFLKLCLGPIGDYLLP